MTRSRLGLCVLLVMGCPPPADAPFTPTASSTALLSSEVPSGAAATRAELPDSVAPTAYRLALQVDPRKNTFRGVVDIDLRVDEPTQEIVLHARELRVSKAEVVVGGQPITAKTSQRAAFGAREGQEELVLQVPAPLAKGSATLHLEYEASFGNLVGIYRVQVGEDWFAFSQMEPTDARRAFPSFDEPRHKTPIELTLEIPHGMNGFANAAEARREEVGELTRIRFNPTEPLPTYLFAVVIGKLETLEGAKTPTPIRFIGTPGTAARGKLSLDVTARVLDTLEQYFDRKYPFGKLDIAAVPNFGPGAMENAGLVTFREELLVLDEKSPANLRRRMTLIMAHELAHQWFGDLVTMRWWDDLWLNEGFATWMAPLVADTMDKDFGGIAERVQDKAWAMNADLLPSARAVRPKVELSDQIREAGGWSAYQKGAAVIAMLESWMGAQAFRGAIRAYVNQNAGRSITSAALFAALDKATGLPVTRVASSFLDQSGFPLVKATLDSSAHELVLQASDATGGDRKWTIPVCVKFSPDRPSVEFAETNDARCVVLDGSTPTRVPAKNYWVLPNAGEAGYFRYDLDPYFRKNLLKSFASLKEEEKAGFILNEWSLVLMGRREPQEILDLLRVASDAKGATKSVTDALITVLEGLDRYYVDDANTAEFRTFVFRILDHHRLRVGTTGSPTDSDITRLERASILAGLLDLGDDHGAMKTLEPIAEAYLTDPRSANADLGPLAVRASVRAGGVAAKTLDVARLARAATPEERVALVTAIASRGGAKELTEVLDLFASGAIRAGDWRHLRNGAMRKRDTRKIFLSYIRDHFDALLKQLGWAGSLTSPISAICEQDQLDLMIAFFKPKLGSLEGAQRGFDEGVADAQRCIALRAKGKVSFGKKPK